MTLRGTGVVQKLGSKLVASLSSRPTQSKATPVYPTSQLPPVQRACWSVDQWAVVLFSAQSSSESDEFSLSSTIWLNICKLGRLWLSDGACAWRRSFRMSVNKRKCHLDWSDDRDRHTIASKEWPQRWSSAVGKVQSVHWEADYLTFWVQIMANQVQPLTVTHQI